ncbi:MAG: RDD family protein [Rhodanobacter sp.]
MPIPAPTTAMPCPLWRRLAALAYDLLAVVAIVMVVGLLCQLATGGRLIGTGTRVLIPSWYRPLQGLVVAAYFISSWRYGGQTLGMRAWRTRLVRSDGGTVTLAQGALRVLVAGLPMAALALAPAWGLRATLWFAAALWTLWFALALFDRRRRTLHDLAAGTELRRAD